MRRWLTRSLLLVALVAFAALAVTLHQAMPPLVAIGIAMPGPGGALVPARALRDGQIWVVEKETARTRRVATTPAGPGQLLVQDGITAGEVVVLDPPRGLAEGQALRLRP